MSQNSFEMPCWSVKHSSCGLQGQSLGALQAFSKRLRQSWCCLLAQLQVLQSSLQVPYGYIAQQLQHAGAEYTAHEISLQKLTQRAPWRCRGGWDSCTAGTSAHPCWSGLPSCQFKASSAAGGPLECS